MNLQSANLNGQVGIPNDGHPFPQIQNVHYVLGLIQWKFSILSHTTLLNRNRIFFWANVFETIN